MEKDVTLRLSPQKAADENEIRKALGISKQDSFMVVRRSVDARRRDIAIDLVCRINPENDIFTPLELRDARPENGQVIIVGSGPAGLFAALELLEHETKPIIIERGKDVHARRLDIARISRENHVDPQSNYSFGEGGAGTYSDGKLFTRSKKRGENSKVLNAFVQFGGDRSILTDAHPHIGTDRLPKIVENMRNAIIAHGGEVLFQTQATDLVIEGTDSSGRQICRGVVATDLVTGKTLKLEGPVILAVGNAARDTFRMLFDRKVAMEAKDIAVGVRLEHPQVLIDQIQYHNPAGRGKYLPAAEYSFATQVKDPDGMQRGVYSFCMCPGGFVVPAASDTDQVVVNGMSPSNRGSRWANSGMVVEHKAKDRNDVLSVLGYQEELERKTFLAASGTQKAPSQRMADFLEGRTSRDLAQTSYAPGLTNALMDEVLPQDIAFCLKEGFRIFGRQAFGFLTNEALLIGTETRTSGPVRMQRDMASLESVNTRGLYPCGEGAGYAGGIVSAAVDGMRCAQSCLQTGREA